MSKPTPADVGRTCLTCGATKTPVWRTGPTGPKTMCNRCGIKWMRRNPSASNTRKRADSPSLSPKSDGSDSNSESAKSPRKKRKKTMKEMDPEPFIPEESPDEDEFNEDDFLDMSEDEPELRSRSSTPIPIPNMVPVVIAHNVEEPSVGADVPAHSTHKVIPPSSPRVVSQSPRVGVPSSPRPKAVETPAIPDNLDSPNRKRVRPNRLLTKENSREFLFSSSSENVTLMRRGSPFELSGESFTLDITSIPRSPITTRAAENPAGRPEDARNNMNEANANHFVPAFPSESTGRSAMVNFSTFIPSALAHVAKVIPTSAFKVVSVPEPTKCPPQKLFGAPGSPTELKKTFGQFDAQIVGLFPASVQYLDFSQQENVSAATLQSLPSSLQYLNLSKCKQLTDSDLLSLPPQLQELQLAHCVQLTDEALRHLPHSLQHLDLSHCYNITDEGLKALPMTLRSLNLSMCIKITDDGLASLPPILTRLNLEGCKISNEGLKCLPPALLHLNVESCEQVTDEGLENLPSSLDHLYLGSTGVTTCRPLKSFNSLRHLDLTACKIGNSSVDNLPPSLDWLNLFQCDGVTEAMLGKLPPHLDFLNLRSTAVDAKSQDVKMLLTTNVKVFI
eukprot:TRINITY_DN2356_c0_g1_i1.p1 TRINITY_DN2356_c0_g1~~TRINITY_DN2356_c0_g1_i1.p1  ORF type:complete len:619 (-),score=109.12 TRINITY_DN2356_c0_g1_i1:83-1939(-)